MPYEFSKARGWSLSRVRTNSARSLLSWDDIQLFLAIARSRTLSSAAPKLNLSQPTLGRRLKALERIIGSPLFNRGSDGLRLTAVGDSILSSAELMEQSAHALEQRLTSVSSGFDGLLRIASRQWIMRHIVGVPISSFIRSHPEMTLAFIKDSHSLDLTGQDADLAVRCVLSDKQAFDEHDIIQRRLIRVQHDVFASSDYLTEHGGWPVDSRGDGHRLIIEDIASPNESRDESWLVRRFPRARPSVHCSCRDVQAVACVQGAGLALLPRSVGVSYPLERLEISEKVPEGGIWLGYHRDLGAVGRLRELVKDIVKSSQKEFLKM